MQRSISHDHKYSIQDMYEITNRNNQVFGIEGYNVVKKYEDPDELIRQRNYATQKKGQKDKRYQTRRGSFMDSIDRIDRKKYPKPTHYDTIINWPDAKPKNPVKKHETKRNTFIDDINNPKNVKAVPGVGQYNLQLTKQQLQEYKDKLKAKKIKVGERDAVFSETEHLANNIPGAGRYHPHDVIQRWKAPPQWDNPKEIKLKHENQEKKMKKICLPEIGTYTPIPCTYDTFAKSFQLFGNVKITGKEPKSKKLGAEERFKDPKTARVKRLIVPGPGNYDMICRWPGKTNNKEPEKKNLQKLITKGISKSIYY